MSENEYVLPEYHYARNHDAGPGQWAVRGPDGWEISGPKLDKLIALGIGLYLSGDDEKARKIRDDWRALKNAYRW